MDPVRVNPLICEECRKEFTSVSNKNRHLRKIHKHDSPKVERRQNIMCSLCPNECREKFSSYNDLDKHYTNIHNIKIKESITNFKSHKEFEAWRGEENRDVNYACTRAVENKKGDRIVYYHCNRSNYRGYRSNCVIRNVKFGGSIHIQGICPSRFSLKISTDGLFTVTFVETHVGHVDVSITAQRLSNLQQLEERSESVLGSPHSDESDTLYPNEPTGTKLSCQDNLTHFIRKSRPRNKSINFEERREMALEEYNSFLRSLDENAFNKFMAETWKLRANMGQGLDEHISKKRKVEKRKFFPNDK